VVCLPAADATTSSPAISCSPPAAPAGGTNIYIPSFTALKAKLASIGVMYLRLKGLKLQGPIGPLSSKFPALVGIDLSDNQLSGVLPPDLASLTKLAYIDLSNNSIHGARCTPWGTALDSTTLQTCTCQT
jgi:hypothetical protein